MIQETIPKDADQKRAMLAQLLRDRASGAVAQVPLSYGQRALWFLNQIDPSSSAYNLMYVCHVRSDVDLSALGRTIEVLGQRHTALRTTYGANAGTPTGLIRAGHQLRLETVDATGWSDEEFAAEISRRSDEPFDLEQGPVIRFQLLQRQGSSHVLLMTSHHIAIDFWSFGLLIAELEEIYPAQRLGRKPTAPAAKVQFADYVRWQEELLAGSEGERLLDYWKQQLAGELPSLDLPTDRTRPPLQTFNGSSCDFHLSDQLSRQLADLAQTENATLYTTLLAAFMVLLYKYTGQTDILVGSPTAGRNHSQLESVIGYFLNPIVLRGRVSPQMSFGEFLSEVRATVLEGIAHQDLPFPLLVERLSPPRDPSRSPIFQVAFAWDKPRGRDHESAGNPSAEFAPPTSADTLGLEPFGLGQQGAAFDLMLMMLSRGESLSAALQYNSDLFDAATVTRIIGHFQALLESIVADPQQPLAELRVMSQTDETQITRSWNDTSKEYPKTAGVHDLFEQQAGRNPEAVAITCGDDEITYAELDRRANQLARYLQGRGVADESCVGLFLDRSIDMAVGLLAIWKAGGAYVPMSLGTPVDRLSYMLEESAAPVVLTRESLVDSLPDYQGEVICVDRDAAAIASEKSEPGASHLQEKQQGNQLAYVMFTSGSTGKPKGVEIEHPALVNFLTSMQHEPGISPDDSLLAITTVTFDISVLEIWLPLVTGARIILATDEAVSDGRQLAQLIEQARPSIMQATPASWRLLVEAGWEGSSELKVLCGGEALPRDLADLLLERSGSLWNMYGPTETTIWSTTDQVREGRGPVSVGKPIANTQIYILDEQMKPVPIGVPGDLYIGGDGLARGYLRRADLTSERFSTRSVSDQPLTRIYHTGDVARYTADGRIEFLGRRDGQVKLRGFRIELGEIEANLNDHPHVREAVVVMRQRGVTEDDKQLVAYLLTDTEQPNQSELREFLKRQLPDYMVPSTFVTLKNFPLNPAGKVDRKALPAPVAARPEIAADYVGPRNQVETALGEVWVSVLGIDRIGVHDNFFELGGGSLQSLQVADGAGRAGYPMTPAMLFQYPTIAELGASLESQSDANQNVDTPTIAPLEPRINPLPSRRAGTSCAAQSSADVRPQNIIIESLGVYLPTQEVTTAEVLKGCRKRIWFPLEKMTGIKTRRKVGEKEFTVDLARKAAEDCLANSQYGPDDIELVVCCGITRIEGPQRFTLEPNISLQLKQQCGFTSAEVFDISNACAGVFTGMRLIQAFIHAGVIRRGMVVSGEYITAITDTAQLEIGGFMDPRLACLTVGDAGAAAIIEASSNNAEGFHALDLYTLGKYSRMCLGQLTDQPHGGAIMHVPDAMQHTAVAVKHSVENARHVFETSPWMPEEMNHLILHQTSERSLKDGMRAINKAFGQPFCNDRNTINNLAHRGNTATTTHLVALWDNIMNDRIQSGDNVVFGITGSGQSIGTGIYTFDDLPDRMRKIRAAGKAPITGKAPAKGKSPARAKSADSPLPSRREPAVRVHSVATLPLEPSPSRDTIQMSVAAAERCLEKSDYDRHEIELLLFAGMTRTDYVSEPAIAALLAGELKMNDIIESEQDRKTLAFDVYSGSLGLLYACQSAVHMIESGQVKTAMIIGSEVEPNRSCFPDHLMGVQETASAVILEVSPEAKQGFGQFEFAYHTEHLNARTMHVEYRDGKPLSKLQRSPDLEQRYLEAIPIAIERLLDREGVKLSDIKAVLPPQISPEFRASLGQSLEIAPDRIVGINSEHTDLFTSSLPYSLEQATSTDELRPGDIALIINVGAGIQVGCATYYF
jgi:amino acid adenylation domain-containing protein